MNGRLYDLVNLIAERRAVEPLRRELLADVHGTVVEIGAGTGANFPFYPADAHVLALEPDRSMAARARLRRRAARAHIELREVDDRFLDTFEAESLDAVVVTLVLCSVPDPAETLARIKRVLRPGGRVSLVEHVRSQGRVGAFQDLIAPAWLRCTGGCHLNRETGKTVAATQFDTGDLRMKQIGRFTPVQLLIYGNLRLRPASP